jgi:hypothetical protein
MSADRSCNLPAELVNYGTCHFLMARVVAMHRGSYPRRIGLPAGPSEGKGRHLFPYPPRGAAHIRPQWHLPRR